MVLQFEEDGVEGFAVPHQQLPGLAQTALQDACWHLRREASGEADDPLCVPLQGLHVHPRLIVEALEVTGGRELHEVPVSLGRACEEREMIVRSATPIVPVGGHVDLAAHDGIYADPFGLT